MVNEEGAHINLRGQLDFNYPKKGIPIEEVESVDEIVQRFKTGAMPTDPFPRRHMRRLQSP